MNDEYHSQTNSSNFQKHVKEKLIEKKETKKVGGHFWQHAILLCAEMFFWFQRNGLAHDATMTKYQTSENAKIKDYILCTCKNMALQSHDPPCPLNRDFSHNSAISIRPNNIGTAFSLSCLCKFAGARISSVTEGDWNEATVTMWGQLKNCIIWGGGIISDIIDRTINTDLRWRDFICRQRRCCNKISRYRLIFLIDSSHT